MRNLVKAILLEAAFTALWWDQSDILNGHLGMRRVYVDNAPYTRSVDLLKKLGYAKEVIGD